MSYGHRIKKIDHDWYRLSWVVDRKYAGSRLRHPSPARRETDLAGAIRFAKKWGLTPPDPAPDAMEKEGGR